jgi:hypothetical protein
MIRFICPKCGAHLKVSDDCAGARKKCRGCSVALTVPDRAAMIPGHPVTGRFTWGSPRELRLGRLVAALADPPGDPV